MASKTLKFIPDESCIVKGAFYYKGRGEIIATISELIGEAKLGAHPTSNRPNSGLLAHCSFTSGPESASDFVDSIVKDGLMVKDHAELTAAYAKIHLPKVKTTDPVDYSKWTNDALKEKCAELELTVDGTKKADYIAAIDAA